ncbi:hypothetical protein SAMN05443572_110190 [Myxococcus fulvus]|uniref:Lipoprotein n=1 Tax=Myxococcus fulvus TaxID=33 RepID=A0ABY1CS34_MYXFU|nr:hypothetical protein SAMN05443572_110190 [Myxococcus fulvus]
MKIKTKVRGGPRGCGPGGISIWYDDVLQQLP